MRQLPSFARKMSSSSFSCWLRVSSGRTISATLRPEIEGGFGLIAAERGECDGNDDASSRQDGYDAEREGGFTYGHEEVVTSKHTGGRAQASLSLHYGSDENTKLDRPGFERRCTAQAVTR